MSGWRDKLRALADRVETVAGGWVVPGLLMALATAGYSAAYWLHKELPIAGTYPDRNGWWTRHDPHKYREQAEAISRWALDGETHHYPIGYALSASPFALWDPQHAFFVPNLFYVLVMTAALYALARRTLRPLESLLVVAAATWACSSLLDIALIIPRSTIATHAAGYTMLALFAWRPPSLALVFQLVFIDGLVYLTRPGDAVFLSPLLVMAVLQLPTWKERGIGGTLGPALLSLFLLANRTLNHSIVRTATTHYEEKHTKGFTFERIFETFYTTYLDGGPIYRSEDVPLFWRMPWLLLVVVGVIWAYRRDGWRQLGVFGTVVGSLCFYLVYQNMDPVSLWNFHLVRYITWAFPVLFVYAWLAVRFGLWRIDKRLSAALVLIPALYFWTLRLEESNPLEVAVLEDGTLRAEGEALPEGYDLIVVREPLSDETALVTVDGRKLQNPREMHKRRSFHKETSLRGVVLYIHDKVAVDRIGLNPELAGREVELRQLVRRWVAVPPQVHKWWNEDPMWGTDDLSFYAVAGEFRDSEVTESTSGGRRELVAHFQEMGRGRYYVSVTGQVQEPTPSTLVVYRGDKVVAYKEVLLRERYGAILRQTFRSKLQMRDLRISLAFPESAGVEIEQIRLEPSSIE
ncbi:MAG: hypothetical protein EP330_10635 [Deltaproteobacteria bacterium]|nr:MAG: hypothetical protein EP330_10635 [Deltaproteobacteria bacterium]